MPQASLPHVLLEHRPSRLVLRLAFPSMAAMLASSLASLTDALFLSRISSSLASAAAYCLPLISFIQTVGFTLGMGAGSFVSRRLADRDTSRSESAASTALAAALALGALICLLGQLFPSSLLRLLGAQKNDLPAMIAYVRFLLAGAPITCASLVLGSLLRAQGRPLPCAAAYALGTLLGAALSYVLICQRSLGVLGAGIAMLAREAFILAVFSYYMLRGHSALRLSLCAVSVHPAVAADIMRSGTPTLVRQGLMSVSGTMLSHALAQFGENAAAGMGLALRAVNLVSSAMIGFSQGLSPVCGANFGAGNTDRVKEAYRFSIRVCTVSLIALGTAVFFFAPALMSRFAPDAASAAFGTAALRAQSAVFFAQGAVILMNALTQSMGLTVRATLISSGRQGYVLIPLLMLLPRFFDARGLIYAQPASDLLSLAIGWALMMKFTGFSFSPCGCCDARRASR